jgi:eukaryotic translation initiation factor 2C
MSRPPNYQELGRDQKKEVTDQFLTTPCVRCGDNSHSCLDCSKCANDHNGHKTGPYGSLNPGKKLGADKWINELKEKYKKNPNDLVLHQAVRNRENQGQQQVPDQKVQKGKSKVEKKGQVQQGEGSNHDASNGKSNDVLQGGLSPTPANQSRQGEASGVQNLHSGSDAVTPYNFDHDRSEIPTSRAPAATNLPERFVRPDRQASDIDPEKLHGQQLDYPTRTEFAKYEDRVTVLTNHFQLMSKGPVKIYEFKIPELEGKGKRKARAIMKSIINNFPELHDNRAQIATDYFTTIVSWVDLRLLMPGASCISLPNDPEQYRLLTFQDGPTTLQYQGTVDMEELFRYVKMGPTISGNTNIKPMIDMFNMIISKCAEESAVATVPGGANKFYRKDAHVPLGNCKALCTHRGYSYTVKAGAGAVLLNVNTLTSAFWCPMMLDQVMNCAPLNNMDWGDFEGLVQGVRVYITYNRGDKKANAETYEKLNSEEGRIKPIVGLSLRRDNGKTHAKRPDQVFFTPRDGTRTSVMDHFNTSKP